MYADLPSLEVNIFPLEILQFRFAHPSIEEGEVDRIQLGRTSFEQPSTLINSEKPRRSGVVYLQLRDMLRRVILEVAPFDRQVEYQLECSDLEVNGGCPYIGTLLYGLL